ncbi:MAG: hypothetical protein K8T26_08615 [Lentisphaerae bacterium]|nr:hypothetical protein [Lentisphaerota bacterium]
MSTGTAADRLTALGLPRGLPGVLELPCTAVRLPNGNTLIADAGDEIGTGAEVIEVDPRGQIVWNFHGGLRFVHSAVRMRNGRTLVADTTNDRVIEVTPDGQIAFSSDQFQGGTGRLSDGTRLSYPNNALELADGNLLITDRNNNRCLTIDHTGRVLWQYGADIRHPHNAEPLPNGNVLLADSDANRIIEITPGGTIAWSYGDGSAAMLNWPRHARRLSNGNTLITDSKNSRVIEVTPAGDTVWCFQVDYFAKFYTAEPLAGGNVLIADQQGHQVLEVDPAGTVVWAFRNYLYPNPIYPRLKDGAFKERAADGWPAHWILMRRFSEGGGEVIWDEQAQPRPCPGLAYDRHGALCLQQTIRAVPGLTYHLAGQLRTQDLDGHACFQLAFVDSRGAAIHDAPQIPRGHTFAGTTDWTQDGVEAVAPPTATAVEVRLFVSGTGRAWMKSVMVHT